MPGCSFMWTPSSSYSVSNLESLWLPSLPLTLNVGLLTWLCPTYGFRTELSRKEGKGREERRRERRGGEGREGKGRILCSFWYQLKWTNAFSLSVQSTGQSTTSDSMFIVSGQLGAEAGTQRESMFPASRYSRADEMKMNHIILSVSVESYKKHVLQNL